MTVHGQSVYVGSLDCHRLTACSAAVVKSPSPDELVLACFKMARKSTPSVSEEAERSFEKIHSAILSAGR